VQTTKSRETHTLSRLQAEAFSEAICEAVTKYLLCLRLGIGVTPWSHRHSQIRRKTLKTRQMPSVLYRLEKTSELLSVSIQRIRFGVAPARVHLNC
jgi:hypothetical protein